MKVRMYEGYPSYGEAPDRFFSNIRREMPDEGKYLMKVQEIAEELNDSHEYYDRLQEIRDEYCEELNKFINFKMEEFNKKCRNIK